VLASIAEAQNRPKNGGVWGILSLEEETMASTNSLDGLLDG